MRAGYVGPELYALWRRLPDTSPFRSSWVAPWWPPRDDRPRPPCPACGQPMHPELITMGATEHPCCGDSSWWTAEAYAQAAELIGAAP